MKFAKSSIVRAALVIVTAAVVAGCASTPKTFANANPSIDMNQFQTFGFFDGLDTDNNEYQSLESTLLENAVTSELTKRGLTRSDNPELIVNFYVNTQEKVKSRTTSIGGYYDFYDPFYGTYVGGYARPQTEVYQITEGTLTIDFVDAASKTLAWEGAAKGRVTDKVRDNLEASVNDAVASIMAAFPVAVQE